MTPGLAFEKAPPFAVPLQFLLAAPLLALPVAALLLLRGPALLATRWSAETLAATHLITLGFIAHSIIGALLQYLPVAGDADLRSLHRLAPWLQAALAVGTLLLAAGFLQNSAPALRQAGWLLALTLGTFVLFAATGLVRCMRNDAALHSIALGLGGLGLTAALGFALAAFPAGAAAFGVVALTNLHAAWGIVGWIITTVAGAALVVVPMFQLTPRYPAAFARALPPLLITAVLALSAAAASSAQLLNEISTAFVALGMAAFGIMTLRLQLAGRRHADVTIWLWRLAMASVIAAAAISLAALAVPAIAAQSWFALLLGILMLAGFAMSTINGMMYKIVPFLVWLHLQNLNAQRRPLPHMRQLIPERAMRWQAGAHGGSIVLLLAALIWAPVVYAAGLLWAVSQLALAANLTRAILRYAELKRALTTPA